MSDPTFVESATVYAGPFGVGSLLAGTYEIVGVLGSGGMNVVYDAVDRSLDRRVAIKVPLAAAFGEALVREARALAAIASPRFPTVHAILNEGDTVRVVMERLVGTTLESHIDELRRIGASMTIEEVLDWLIEIAKGLSAAHAAGVSHRDLKPSNILRAGTRVVLFDLGLAVPEVLVHGESEPAGSVRYMAPEVILGDVHRGGGPLVDLYALGNIAFELLTGDVPFVGDSMENVLANHVCAEIPDVRALRKDVPRELAALVTELLAKSPDARPPSAESVVWQLEALVPSAPPSSRSKVLVVDDEPHVGEALRRALESTFPRLTVETTTSPDQLVAASDREIPDIVLVDLNMPKSNGIEVCMSLMALPAKRRPRVVAMSSQAEPRDVAVLQALGVNDFVAKDAEFLPHISHVIGRLHER